MKFLKFALACVVSIGVASTALAATKEQPIKSEYGAQLSTLITNNTFVQVGETVDYKVALSGHFIGVPNKYANYEDEIRSVVVKYTYKRGTEYVQKNSTVFMFNLVNCDTKSMITAGLVLFDPKKELTLADSLEEPTWETTTPNTAERHIVNVVCNV
jgi:hypothetical protein